MGECYFRSEMDLKGLWPYRVMIIFRHAKGMLFKVPDTGMSQYIDEYWNISGAPVLPGNVPVFSRNSQLERKKWYSIVQQSYSSIWDLKYTSFSNFII